MADSGERSAEYDAWLDKLREVGEAMSVVEQVIRVAMEGFKQYRHEVTQ
jgi:hypothetical protein